MNLHNVKSFELAGITYSVKYVKEINGDNSILGMTFPEKHSVEIVAGFDSDKGGQVFCHELTHCILSVMGENALYENEKFVDLFGSFLYQAMKTLKGA